jgi:hypothetical protein
MKLIIAQNVYSFVLEEGEWYTATQQQREAWINQITREAQAAACTYATILVDPDPVMSLSHDPKRHKVWGMTFTVDNAETKFRDGLLNFLCDAEKELSISDVARLARRVISEYAR